MRAPLAYVATRSRKPPSSAHTDWPMALPLRSQHAMSTAESASVKMPPGPELPAARRSLAVMASTWVGSSPTVSRASSSTAVLSAGVSAPPKNVSPRPTAPWSVPSSRVTNSRVSVGAGSPTTSGLSAGVRSARVVTCVIFIESLLRGSWSPTIHSCARAIHQGSGPARPRPPRRLHRSRAVRAGAGPHLRPCVADPRPREPGAESGRLLHDTDGAGAGHRGAPHRRGGARLRQPLRPPPGAGGRRHGLHDTRAPLGVSRLDLWHGRSPLWAAATRRG